MYSFWVNLKSNFAENYLFAAIIDTNRQHDLQPHLKLYNGISYIHECISIHGYPYQISAEMKTFFWFRWWEIRTYVRFVWVFDSSSEDRVCLRLVRPKVRGRRSGRYTFGKTPTRMIMIIFKMMMTTRVHYIIIWFIAVEHCPTVGGAFILL